MQQGPDAACAYRPGKTRLARGAPGTIWAMYESLQSHRRYLSDSVDDSESRPASNAVETEVTIVRSGAELSSALLNSATHVELQNHVYLPYVPDFGSLEIFRVRISYLFPRYIHTATHPSLRDNHPRLTHP